MNGTVCFWTYLGVLTSLMLGPLAVNVVKPLGLAELVDLSTGKASEEFLGELVADGLACVVSIG